jgi:hypothetical protein
MAWDFVINFAKDNNLHVSEGTFVPPANKAVIPGSTPDPS